MPLNSDLVGATTNTLTHEVDARWIMAYAAALGDFNPLYMDTQQHQVIAHPVFPVCPEWPVILDTRNIAAQQTLLPSEAVRGVHAAHDLHIYKPISAGDTVATQATMIGVKAIAPGARYTMRLDTVNKRTNELLARTYQTGIYRGVEVDGGTQELEPLPDLPQLVNLAGVAAQEIHVPTGAAHTYTECARIWNPIHTDRAVALEAGLPDIILHGTATLALAVSHIVDKFADGDPSRIKRLGGRFAAMVLMPSTITIQCHLDGNVVSYQVTNEQGELAISQGFVCLS